MTGQGQEPYRVGVIGCGRAGTSRARAFDLHPRCQVAAIADSDPENLALATRRFAVPGYASWEEMFARQELDIAMPVLPVRPNADAVVAAAEAGVKAIFCEKPLTARLADADRMVAACRARQVHLAAGVVISSHPDYRKAYRLVAEGRIGQVQRINLYEGNGQGGCHGLNLARKFAGKAPVEWVSGWVEGDPHSDFEEPYAEAEKGFGPIGGYIRFANGIECFSAYRDVPWKGIEVVGSEGVVANWNNTALGLRLWNKVVAGRPNRAESLIEEEGLFDVHRSEDRGYDSEGWRDVGDTMRSIVENIVAALDSGAELEVTTGDDLRHALEIAIALRQSHREGHRAIALPLADRQLVMYPEKGRWHYKKEVYGREWYMDQMATHRQGEAQ